MRTITPKKVILVRVGIDQSFGSWNAPCDPSSGDFIYIPIPEDQAINQALATCFDNSMSGVLKRFSDRSGRSIVLPSALKAQPSHLDPDFDYLTYGDTNRRGKRLLSLQENDWIMFYSGLRSIKNQEKLVYALTGILVVENVQQVKNISPQDYSKNAHTRLAEPEPTDIVVTGKPEISGRFRHYIDIGEFRNRSYRVRKDLLDVWGDLGVNDGWIQRSANPPWFKDPAKFAKWLNQKHPGLIKGNN